MSIIKSTKAQRMLCGGNVHLAWLDCDRMLREADGGEMTQACRLRWLSRISQHITNAIARESLDAELAGPPAGCADDVSSARKGR